MPVHPISGGGNGILTINGDSNQNQTIQGSGATSVTSNGGLITVSSSSAQGVTSLQEGTAIVVDSSDPENPIVNADVGTNQGQIPQFGSPEYGMASYPSNYVGNTKAFTVLPDNQGKTASLDNIMSWLLEKISLPSKVKEIVLSSDTTLNDLEMLPSILVANPTADAYKIILPKMSGDGYMYPLSVGQEFSIININENEYSIDVVDFDGNTLQTIKAFEMYNFVVQDVSTPAGEFLPYGRLLFLISPDGELITGVRTLNTDNIETKTGAVNQFLNPQTIMQTSDAYSDTRVNKVITDTQLANLNYYSTNIISPWEVGQERVICPIGYCQAGIFSFYMKTTDSSGVSSAFGFTAQVSFINSIVNQFNFKILSFDTDAVIFSDLQDFLDNFTFNVYQMPEGKGLFTMTLLNNDLPTDFGWDIWVSYSAGVSLYQAITPYIGTFLLTCPIQPVTTGTTFIPDVYGTDDTGAQEEFTWTPADATGTVTLSNAFGTGIKRGNEVELYFTGIWPTTTSTQFVQINGWNPIYNPKDNSGIGVCIISANSPTNTFPNQVGVVSSNRLSLTCNGYQSKLADVSGQLFRGKISYLINT